MEGAGGSGHWWRGVVCVYVAEAWRSRNALSGSYMAATSMAQHGSRFSPAHIAPPWYLAPPPQLVHGDVFRFPPYLNLFCAVVGTGTQVGGWRRECALLFSGWRPPAHCLCNVTPAAAPLAAVHLLGSTMPPYYTTSPR